MSWRPVNAARNARATRLDAEGNTDERGMSMKWTNYHRASKTFAIALLAGAPGCQLIVDDSPYDMPRLDEGVGVAGSAGAASTDDDGPNGGSSGEGGGGSPGPTIPSPAPVLPPSSFSIDAFPPFARGSDAEYSVLEPAQGLLRDAAPGLQVIAEDGPRTTRRGGVVELLADGTFRYRPPSPAFWGDDYFEYTAGNAATSRRIGVRLTVRPSTVSLADARAGGSGRVIRGVGGGDVAAAHAGDVDGDGRGDLIVRGTVSAGPDSARLTDNATCVVLAKHLDATPLDLTECDATGFAIMGGFPGYARISGAGDVNGDGLDDLLVADLSSDLRAPDGGAVYVVYGRDDATPVSLDEFHAGQSERGFVVAGLDPGSALGTAVAPLGDFDGDGYGDVALGAPANVAAAAIYVIRGGPATSAPLAVAFDPDIPELESDRFLTMQGASGSGFAVGEVLAGAGDFNGDGLDDLVLGLPDATNTGAGTGGMYVVLGRRDLARVVLSAIHNQRQETVQLPGGFARFGQLGAHAGSAVAGVGDFDGDGYDDVVYAASGGNDPALPVRLWVVFGGPLGQTPIEAIVEGNEGSLVATLLIDDVPGPGGAPVRLAGAGDMDGDGLGDLAIALPDDEGGRGMVIVMRGARDREPRSLRAILEGREVGAVFQGEAQGDLAGASLSGGRDLDGDGLHDLILSSGRPATASNATYALLGWDLAGTLGPRALGEARGSDDDEIELVAPPAVRIDGGHGIDTLRVSGTAELDLRALSSLHSIERIDLRGGGPTRLLIDDTTLRRLAKDRSELPELVSRALEIVGDTDDHVEVTDPQQFAAPLPSGAYPRIDAFDALIVSGGMSSNLTP